MATLTDETQMPEPIFEAAPVTLQSLLSKDAGGNDCLTEEALDNIWPRDDREPLVVVGKGVTLPPTCTSEFVPCYVKMGNGDDVLGDQLCREFVFDGPPIPQPHGVVPLPSAGVLMLTVVVGAAILKRIRA